MSSLVRSHLFVRQTCLPFPLKRVASSFPQWGTPTSPRPVPSLLSPRITPRRPFAKGDTSPLFGVAAFHSSGHQSILPPGPQRIDGTINDPAPTPEPEPGHGSYHWTFERLVAAALIPLTVAPFAAGTLNPITDAVLCGTILIHSHIGFQSIIIDYVPWKRLPKTRTLFWWGLRGATLIVAVGLYEFETTDVGVTEAIKRIWKA